MISSSIPFAGFYETHHDASFDDELDRLFQDDSGHDMPWTDALKQRFFDNIDWAKCHEAYAKKYTEQFKEKFGLQSMVFEKLQSPKEYNFVTDRIFVHISEADVILLWALVDQEIFKAKCKEKFTSRSGFISFYSPNPDNWGFRATWDHNQIGTLVEAYASNEDGEWDYEQEYDLCEDFSGSGYVQNWIYEFSDIGNRLDAIHQYLLKRSQR